MKQDYKTSVPKGELAESAKTRAELLAKWGFEPTQLWILPKIHDKTLDVLVEDTLAQNTYETQRDGGAALAH